MLPPELRRYGCDEFRDVAQRGGHEAELGCRGTIRDASERRSAKRCGTSGGLGFVAPRALNKFPHENNFLVARSLPRVGNFSGVYFIPGFIVLHIYKGSAWVGKYNSAPIRDYFQAS